MRTRSMVLSLFILVLSLPATAAITGTVINPDGHAVTGAKISLFTPETADARRARLMSATPQRTPLATGQSDSKGNFSIDSPKEPVVDLRIDATGFAPEGTRVTPDEEIGAIALASAPLVKGTITAGGKALAGATVIWASVGGESVTTTDADGHYSVPDPNKWANRVVVAHKDYAMVDEVLGRRESKKSLDWTLTAGTTVSGRVVGADGQTPAAKAAIFLDAFPAATTDDDGTFTIAHAPKSWTSLEARSAGLVGSRANSSNVASIAIRLARAATVGGVVRDAKTLMPLAGVEVRLAPFPTFGAGFGNNARSVLTDAKGNYSIATLPGSYRVDPVRVGYTASNVTVNVTSGQSVQKAIYANPRGRVIGTVVDDDKRPVAGAHLGARPAAREQAMMIGGGGGQFGVDSSAYSGPDGRFVLRSVATEADMQVDAAKKGFPTGRSAMFKLAPAERKPGVVITIPRGIALTGKVTDRNDRPLSGASVEAVEAANEGFGGMRRMVINLARAERSDEVVRTGSDGAFTIRLKEGTYDVVFKREGFANKTVRGATVNATTKPLTVSLEPGVEITGRVTRGGIGIEGVDVNAMSQEGMANSVTSSDGSFRLSDLTPGQMMLSASKREDFIQQMKPVSAPAQDVVFELPSGGKITGRVIDKGSHKPVTTFQAGITMSRSGGGMMIQMPPMLKAFTSDDGTFTLENVPPGATQIVVNAPGYTTGRVPGLNVEDGKTINDVEVSLDAGAKLSGHVTGPDGSPLAGVRVAQDVAGGPGRMMRFDGLDSATVTDPNGEYTIESLESGEKTFTFSRQGYLSESKTITVSASTPRLDVQLTNGVRLTGSVVNESGAPVAEALVTASSASDPGFGGKQARTDTSGGFQLEGLAPGHYTLTASKNGFANGIMRDFDVAAGAPARITMKSGGTIMGHVTGLTDAELQNATVTATSPNGNASAPVDNTGNYHMEGAPSGTVRVTARTGAIFGGGGKSSPMKSVQVDPGSSVQVDIEFKTSTVVRGRVTRDGQPMGNAFVSFFPRGAQSTTNANTNTDSSGNYEVSGLEDAQYNVQIMDFQRTTPFTTTFEVRGSSTFDIDIKSSTVRGRVLDAATGSPIADARVEIHMTGGDVTSMMSSRTVVTDAAGSFTIDSVARGNYEAKADKEGYGHEIRTVTVGDTAAGDLEFKLEASSGVTITAVDARDNRALSANVIQVVDAQGRQVDSGPMMRFGSSSAEPVKLSLAPGTYRVTLSAMGYATQTVNVVSPSSPIVRMSPGGTVVIRSKANGITRARLVDANGNAFVRGGFFGGGGGVFTIDASPGVTTLQNVAPGPLSLQILGAGDAVIKTIPVTVIEGQPTAVDV